MNKELISILEPFEVNKNLLTSYKKGLNVEDEWFDIISSYGGMKLGEIQFKDILQTVKENDHKDVNRDYIILHNKR